MARPTHRLDLLLVPTLGLPIERGEGWLSGLVGRGVVRDDGRPGPYSDWLGVGGFARVHLDRPPRPTLYANRLGGFRVQCPACGTGIVAAFAAAVNAWRAGGPASVACPSCGAPHPLDGVDARPPLAIGAWAVVAAEVDTVAFAEEALADAQRVLGSLRVIARRT